MFACPSASSKNNFEKSTQTLKNRKPESISNQKEKHTSTERSLSWHSS